MRGKVGKKKKIALPNTFKSRVLPGIVISCALWIAANLYYVQVVEGQIHTERMNGMYAGTKREDLQPRGDIYFTYKNGERMLAATDSNKYALVINNRNVKDPQRVRSVLGDLGMDREKLEKILAKTNDPYEVLEKDLSGEHANILLTDRVPGIEVHTRKKRSYPAGSLGSSLIGFTSYVDDLQVGTYGLEKYYDHLLRRQTSDKRKGIFSQLLQKPQQEEDVSPVEKNIRNEATIVTSIEPNIQRKLNESVKNIAARYKAEYAAGIIMDPKSGRIVAMTQSDNIDLKKPRHYRNHNIEDRLELGSIIKPLTVAIGLETKTINPNFSYNDTGSIVLNTRTISNFDKRGRGPYTTLQTILTNSLNTGVVKIALAVGMNTFRSYIDNLGLPYETGIDLPYESYGLTSNLDSNRKIDLATASFGQGIAITPIEAIKAFATLANGGKTVTPYITEQVEYGSLIPSKQIPVDNSSTIFSHNTVSTVNKLLANITEQSPVFKDLALPYHHVAIKTGTAQVIRPNGGYYRDKYLHSMVGHVPAHARPNEQSYVMMMYVMKPQGVRYSSTSLKEPFFDMTKYLVDYYELIPDKEQALDALVIR